MMNLLDGSFLYFTTGNTYFPLYERQLTNLPSITYATYDVWAFVR